MVGSQFLSLQKDAVRWPNGLKQAAAVCNSLTLIGRDLVVGELDERRAFKAVEARFLVSPLSCHCMAWVVGKAIAPLPMLSALKSAEARFLITHFC